MAIVEMDVLGVAAIGFMRIAAPVATGLSIWKVGGINRWVGFIVIHDGKQLSSGGQSPAAGKTAAVV